MSCIFRKYLENFGNIGLRNYGMGKAVPSVAMSKANIALENYHYVTRAHDPSPRKRRVRI
jgi:hypothetical protein